MGARDSKPLTHDTEDRVDEIADRLYPEAGDGWSRLTSAERTVFAIWALKVEVCNGGFAQFFHNSVGEATPSVIEAVGAVGADPCADLLRQAWAVFGRDIDLRDPERRAARADGLSAAEREALDRLDQAFFAAKHDLLAKALAFARAHAREIR